MRSLAIRLLAISLCFGGPAMAGDNGNGNAKPEEPKNSSSTSTSRESQPANTAGKDAEIESQLQQLRELLQNQAQQLESQRSALQQQKAEIESLKIALKASKDPAVMTVTIASPGISVPGPLDASPAPPQQSGSNDKDKAPLSIKIGTADFTPLGFMDFTTVFRSTNVGSGIGTSFGGIPFNNNTPGAGLTETRFSAQNSRIGLKVNAKVGASDVVGYLESDFLGQGPTNLVVTSNSNTLRMRLYWVDVRRGKWEILGGQSWSMMNPNRVGISPYPGDVFFSQDMDTNYQVGLTWARQAQFRVVYHPTSSWALGLSFENPEQLTGGAVVFPTLFANAQVNTGANNTATPNVHPDIILKAAHDAKVRGRNWHVEAVGLLSSFKLFTPASVTGGAAGSTTRTGGGVSVNANLEIFKNFHLIANTFWSDGGGRYIFGLGPNLIVRQTGSVNALFSPSPVHAGSGIGGFEWQVTKPVMLYGYYGGAYYGRNTAIDPKTGSTVGYGFTGSSNSANRAIQEGTLGLIQTIWKNPQYGALQIITQASYLTRAPWFVATGAPKNAHLGMVFVDLRYVIP